MKVWNGVYVCHRFANVPNIKRSRHGPECAIMMAVGSQKARSDPSPVRTSVIGRNRMDSQLSDSRRALFLVKSPALDCDNALGVAVLSCDRDTRPR